MEEEKPGLGSTILGSVLAIPLIFIVFVVVSIVANAGMLLMSWLDQAEGGVTRWAQLIAAAFSSWFGVLAARHCMDAAFKSWNGWPTFTLFTAARGAISYVVVNYLVAEANWWRLAVDGIQVVVAFVASFFVIALKKDVT